jgi:hypothetical protein
MSEHPMTDPLEPTVAPEPQPAAAPPARASRGRGRRVLAVVAGVAMVPALYAAASAVTGAGDRPAVSAGAGADDTVATPPPTPGTEIETEHGVTTVTPDDDATRPTTPAPTTPTTPDDSTPPPATDDTTPPPASDAPAAVSQTFTSAGGSIEVTLANGSLTLDDVTPAAGYTTDVHDGGGERVEVRFFDAQGKEWRIRIEVAGSAMTQEITFHG